MGYGGRGGEGSLVDLIRGIRANKHNEEPYIAQCLNEIRGELKRNDPDVKATAIAKLFYLHMMGYDMSWASFHVIEVMSSPKYSNKRIGYVAAATSFRQDTDVLMLCTNLLKKDMTSNNYLETALALNGLAAIATPDLARDLCPDLIAMLNHSRPYIRKRVIIVLYKVFLKYPEALRLAFPRLKDKLDDPDPTVVSAAVNVICELARKNPKSYLPLAPQLYSLLTHSSNNWMLIKIVKLFGALTPLEPRLIKKLVPPISSLIQSTEAMSLLYECLHTVIVGGMIAPESQAADSNSIAVPLEDNANDSLTRLCVSKLKIFIGDSDQNLKYLGLYALCKLLPLRPRAVTEHRDVVLECLDDKDISIKMRALELITGMVTKRNLPDIVRKLLKQLIPLDYISSSDLKTLKTEADRTYSAEVISRILSVCSRGTYEIVTDFEWYIGILARLAKVPGVSVGDDLASQLVDVSVRVREVRGYAVKEMFALLQDLKFLDTAVLEENNTPVLYAAAWICGEYSGFLLSKPDAVRLLTAAGTSKLNPSIQSIYMHSALKIYAAWITSAGDVTWDHFQTTTKCLIDGFTRFSLSSDIEVQERASIALQLLHGADTLSVNNETKEPWAAPAPYSGLIELFDGELNPVAVKAQKKVPVPEGLDLDIVISNAFEQVLLEDNIPQDGLNIYPEEIDRGDKLSVFEDNDAKAKRIRDRDERMKSDPFYIVPDIDSIPIVKLDIDSTSLVDPPKKTKTKKIKPKKARTAFDDLVPSQTVSYQINRTEEMPENARDEPESPDDVAQNKSIDPDTLAVLSVDLTKDVTHPLPELHRTSRHELREGDFVVTRKRVNGQKKRTVKKLSGAAVIDATSNKGEKKQRLKKGKVLTSDFDSEMASVLYQDDKFAIGFYWRGELGTLNSMELHLQMSCFSPALAQSSGKVYLNSSSSSITFDGQHDVSLDLAVDRSVKAPVTVSPTISSLLSLEECSGVIEFNSGGLRNEISFHFPFFHTFNLREPENLTMDPTKFASMLTTSANFSSSSVAVVKVPSSGGFVAFLSTFCKSHRFKVVELITGAASIYAETWMGVPIAGLIKVRHTSVDVEASIELKCSDIVLLEDFRRSI